MGCFNSKDDYNRNDFHAIKLTAQLLLINSILVIFFGGLTMGGWVGGGFKIQIIHFFNFNLLRNQPTPLPPT